jgi:HEPN domain-containing protein
MKKRVASYLELARRDLAHATDALDRHPADAAFSAQQAAEKIIKAVLTQQDIAFPATTPQLDLLVGLLPGDHLWRAALLDWVGLTSAATAYRYPTASDDIPRDPDRTTIARHLTAIRTALPEIADWCREHPG